MLAGGKLAKVESRGRREEGDTGRRGANEGRACFGSRVWVCLEGASEMQQVALNECVVPGGRVETEGGKEEGRRRWARIRRIDVRDRRYRIDQTKGLADLSDFYLDLPPGYMLDYMS
jgi:hypothetical protein